MSNNNTILPETALNYKGEPTKIDWPKGILRLRVGSVYLIQATGGAARYSVVYGLEVTSELSYKGACEALGACLMHQLTCELRGKGVA